MSFDPVASRANPAILACSLDRGFVEPPHIRLAASVIRAVILSGGGLVLVQMPPRHGKSTLCSKWLPLWFLDLFPAKNVILASHTATFAESWGRRARNAAVEHAERLLFTVATDSAAVSDWRTNEGGGMIAVGVGGPVTGRGGDLIVVDDPVKDAVQANSQTWRERSWEWWQETLYTRREPGATIVVPMTRWHEDDLGGRLLLKFPSARVIRFPAVAEDKDELGRAEGEALWPERFPRDELDRIREAVGSYAWSALYQQRPSPPEGAMFKRDHVVAYRDLGDRWLTGKGKVIEKRSAWVAQVADTAMTAKSESDWTAIGTFACGPRGEILVLEVTRARIEIPEQWALMQATRARWRGHPGYRWLGVEDSPAGKALIQIAQRSGDPVRALELGRGEWRTPDKVTRAMPASVACENGMLHVPESNPDWLAPFLHELLYFPKGAHDDQVDTLSLFAIEAREAARGYVPDRRVRSPEDEAEEKARGPFGRSPVETFESFGNVRGSGLRR